MGVRKIIAFVLVLSMVCCNAHAANTLDEGGLKNVPGMEDISSSTPKYEIAETELESITEHETEETEAESIMEHETEETEAESIPEHETEETEAGSIPEHETEETEAESILEHETEEIEAESIPEYETEMVPEDRKNVEDMPENKNPILESKTETKRVFNAVQAVQNARASDIDYIAYQIGSASNQATGRLGTPIRQASSSEVRITDTISKYYNCRFIKPTSMETNLTTLRAGEYWTDDKAIYVKLDKSASAYSSQTKYAAIYRNAVVEYTISGPKYYDVRLTLQDYRRVKDGNKSYQSCNFGFYYYKWDQREWCYPGCGTSHLNWIEVTWEFLVAGTGTTQAGTGTAKRLAGIMGFDDIDYAQGIYFQSGFGWVNLPSNSLWGSNVNFIRISNGSWFNGCYMFDGTWTGQETSQMNSAAIIFDSAVLNTVLTFARPTKAQQTAWHKNGNISPTPGGGIGTVPTESWYPTANLQVSIEKHISLQDDKFAASGSADTECVLDKSTITGKYWADNDTLKRGKNGFYYYLRLTVGEWSYNIPTDLYVEDILPQWVMQTGTAQIFNVDGIKDTSYWDTGYSFRTDGKGHQTWFRTKEGVLNQAGFYNKTYVFRIPVLVRGDDFSAYGEPAQNASGQWYWDNSAETTVYGTGYGAIKSNTVRAFLSEEKMELPSVKKYVGASKSVAGTSAMSNTVRTYGSIYYYRIQVDIPSLKGSGYSKCQLEDYYPKWIRNVTESDCAVYDSEGNNVGTSENDTALWKIVTGTDSKGAGYVHFTGNTSADEFYGKTYYFYIKASVKERGSFPSKPGYDNGSGKYYWTNLASINVNNGSGMDTEIQTNTVTTYILPIMPSCSIRKNVSSLGSICEAIAENGISNMVSGYGEKYYYYLYVTLGALDPMLGKEFEDITLTDTLPEWVEPVSTGTVTARDENGEYAGKWDMDAIRKDVRGRSIYTFTAASDVRYDRTYVFQIRVKVKDSFEYVPPMREWYYWENTAKINREGVETESNTVVTTMKFPVTDITVTKHIYKDETIWAHGNPVFIFTLSGQDMYGVDHTYAGSVEFRKDCLSEEGDGTYKMSYTFENVPMSEAYFLYEKQSLGYYLTDVKGDSNVSITRKQASEYGAYPAQTFSIVINTKNKMSGTKVSLWNRKQNFDDPRHTDIAINMITIENSR